MAKGIFYLNRKDHDKLLEENGELFERNSTKPKTLEQLPSEPKDGYCQCGGKIIYPSGIPTCSSCGSVPEISFEEKRKLTRSEMEEREIRIRVMEEETEM